MNSKEFDKKLFEIQKEELLSWLHLESDLPYFLESNVRVIFDRLEQLEKENQELRKKLDGIPPEFDGYLYFAKSISNIIKENTKLKKALDILKEVVSLNCDKTLETERQFLRLSQEEYELLKEVLDCE
jgi:uncharacterized protein (UPF0335 family)